MRRPFFFLIAVAVLTAGGCKKDNSTSTTTDDITTALSDVIISGLVQRSGFDAAGEPAYSLVVSGKNFTKNFKDQKVLFNDITVSAFKGDSLNFEFTVPDAAVASPSTLTVVVNGKSNTLAEPPGSRYVSTRPTYDLTQTEVDADHNIYLSAGNNELIVIKNGVVSNTHFAP